jgi:signal transduction histidine kinase
VGAADRARDDFLSVVSHELRTPLNAILGWAQILTRSPPPDPEMVRRGLSVIYRNALAQTRIVDDILDAARLASGELVVARQPLSLEPVVRAALQSMQPEIDARGISLTVSLDAAPIVLGDAERLKQVVRNLLSNAVKFTPERGEVAVRLDQEGGVARVTVTDSGRGIAAADLPHLFDRFRQGESSTSRSAGGLGLGLAIARHLVEAHGGEVRGTSAGPGLGSTFTVELPT